MQHRDFFDHPHPLWRCRRRVGTPRFAPISVIGDHPIGWCGEGTGRYPGATKVNDLSVNPTNGMVALFMVQCPGPDQWEGRDLFLKTATQVFKGVGR